MKAIFLHTAAADNGGQRHDAGATMSVGKDAREIDAARAAALVAAGSAIDATPSQSAKGGK